MSPNAVLGADILMARRRGEGAEQPLPALTIEEAYEVQAAVIARLAETVGGWKLAIVDGTPTAAPLAASTILRSGCRLACEPDAPFKIETELGFTLRHDLPTRPNTYSRDEIVAAIESVHVSFEIVGARLGEPPDVAFTAFLADNLGNAYTVAAFGCACDALPQHALLRQQGAPCAEGRHPNGDPLAPLVAYANRPADRLGGLRQGQLIITGSFNKAIPVTAGSRFEGVFEGLAPVEITFFAKGHASCR
jgi:2-keto-4-pentenoate hydratase